MAMLLNRAEVRRRVLTLCGERRPDCGFTRVSGRYLDWLEGRVMNMLEADVHRHPTVGATFGLGMVSSKPKKGDGR